MNSFTSAPFATTIFEEFTSLLFDRNKKKEDVLHVDNIQLPVQAATSQKIEKKKQNK